MLTLRRRALALGLALALSSGCAHAAHGSIVDELDVFGLHLGELQQEVDDHGAAAGDRANRVSELEVEYRAAARQRIGLLWDSLEQMRRCSDDARIGRFAYLADLVGRAHAETDRHFAAAQTCASDSACGEDEVAHARAMDALFDALWNQVERTRAKELRAGPTRCTDRPR